MDGKALRWRYSYECHVPEPGGMDCSVLEMMVALALRCEETIMDDPKVGNRTRQWFTGMLISMGLGSQINRNYNHSYVMQKINDMMYRRYNPDGSNGGLFTLHRCSVDIRNVEIWYQLSWYLNELGNTY